MPEFALTTIWSIPAPIEKVWSCLLDTKTWPLWWKYVVSVEETNQQPLTQRSLWRTCLPYTLLLNLQLTELQAYHSVSVIVSGDLHGQGFCRLFTNPDTLITHVEFNWQVATCKPWMNHFSRFTQPIFAWNHAKVMRCGERSLIRYLSSQKT